MSSPPPFLSDQVLVLAARQRDARAFTRLVIRHQGVACAVGYAATGDAGLAEDLAQEAFVVAWRRLDSLAEPDRFSPWLCGIVRNLARSHRRHLRRHAPPATALAERLADLPSPAPDPRELATSREALARTWAALRRLPPSYREPLVLHCQLGRSYSRVARDLGLSEVTVRQRISRARRQLRDHLDGAPLALAPRGLVFAVLAAIGAATRAAAAPASLGLGGAALAAMALALALTVSRPAARAARPVTSRARVALAAPIARSSLPTAPSGRAGIEDRVPAGRSSRSVDRSGGGPPLEALARRHHRLRHGPAIVTPGTPHPPAPAGRPTLDLDDLPAAWF